MPSATVDDVAKFRDEQKSTLPNLYKLQQKHHLIPATSSAIERSFSCDGVKRSQKSNRLNDDVFEQTHVIKLNSDLMQ